MPLYDGSLKFDTSIDTKGFEQGIKKLEDYAKKGSLAVAAAASAITAATVKMGKDSLAAYADFEQLVGGVETLFKKSADSVVANANNAFKTAGMSANKYMETVTGFSASLLQSLDGDTQKAMEKADTTIIDMSDNANKMGTDITMIQNAYQGFAKQNYTMLDNLKLGYGGTKEEMQRLLIEAEKLSGIKYDILSFADIVDAIHVVQTELGITGTTAKEATSTIQGSFGMLKASWENFMVGLADSEQDLDKLIDDVISSAGTVIDNVAPRIEIFITNLIDIIDKRLPYLKDTLIGIATIFAGMKIGSSIQTIVQGFQAAQVQLALYSATANGASISQAALNGTLTLGQTAVALLTGKITLAELATGLWTKSQAALNAVISANPIMLAVTAVAALAAGTIILSNNIDSASNRLKELTKSHEEAIKAIDDNTSSEMRQAETAKILTDKLFDLENQIHNEKLTEEEVAKVKNEYNNIASQLNEIIPDTMELVGNETNAYYSQKDALAELTESYYKLAYAKAMVTAYQAKIDQTASDILAAKDELKTAEENSFMLFGQKVYYGPNADAIMKAPKTIEQLTNEMESYISELANYKEQAENLSKLFDNSNGAGNKNPNPSNSGGTTPGGSAAKQQTKEISEEFEKQYKNLKRQLEREKISHSKYYQDLKALRDKYFTEGSDEWEKYTEELGDFANDTFDDCLDRLEEFKDKSLSQIEALKNEQQQLKESLMPDKSPIEWGTINGEGFVSLANYDKEINQARRYGEMLDALLKKRADIPQSVIDEIKGMDADQAMRYMEALLNSSDIQFNLFIENRKKLEEAASENSKKLMSAEAEEMKRILEEKFGELPEDFFELGNESGSAFGEAFLDELNKAMSDVRNSIMSQMDAMVAEAKLTVASINASSGGGSITTNNYNSSYNFNSSKETTTQQIFAAKNAATLERLRGGYSSYNVRNQK